MTATELVETIERLGSDAATYSAAGPVPTWTDVASAIMDEAHCTSEQASNVIQWLGAYFRAVRIIRYGAPFMMKDCAEYAIFCKILPATGRDDDLEFDPYSARGLLLRYLTSGGLVSLVRHYTVRVGNEDRSFIEMER